MNWFGWTWLDCIRLERVEMGLVRLERADMGLDGLG